MNSYKELHKSICRICLNYGNTKSMVCLVGRTGLSCYGKSVQNFANISIERNDFPSSMCQKCLQLLKQAIRFKFLCESSEKCLQDLAKNRENIKESVVELAMLKLYLPEACHEDPNKNSDDKPETIQSLVCEKNLGKDLSDASNDENLLDEMERLDSNIFGIKQETRRSKRNLKVNKIKKEKKVTAGVVQKKVYKRKEKVKTSIVCSICDKVLGSKMTYDRHMQRHKGRHIVCEHCGKGFSTRAELRFHQLHRHGIGPYLQCSHCPFKAARKFDLTEHERTHTGERPYTCEKCGATFQRRACWRQHLLYHMDKTVQCPQCPKKFYQRFEMLAHANSVHERMYMYLCSKCGATYTKPATVRRHMTQKHGIPRELQGKITRMNKDSSIKKETTKVKPWNDASLYGKNESPNVLLSAKLEDGLTDFDIIFLSCSLLSEGSYVRKKLGKRHIVPGQPLQPEAKRGRAASCL